MVAREVMRPAATPASWVRPQHPPDVLVFTSIKWLVGTSQEKNLLGLAIPGYRIIANGLNAGMARKSDCKGQSHKTVLEKKFLLQNFC